MQSRKAIVSAAAFVVAGLALVGCESSSVSSTDGEGSSSGTIASSAEIGPYQTGTYQTNQNDYSNTSPETPGVARPAGGRVEPQPGIESQPGTMDDFGGPGSSARPSQPTDGNVYSSPSDSSRGSMGQGRSQDINAQPAGAAIPGSLATQPSPMTTQPSRQSTGSQSSSLDRDSTSGRSGQLDTSAQPAGTAISGSSTTRPAQQSQQGMSGSSSWDQPSGSSSMDQTTGQPAGSSLPGQSGMPATRATTQPSGMSPRSSSDTWGSAPDQGTSPGASSSSDDLSGGSLAQPAGSGMPGGSTTQPSQQ